MSLAGTDWLFTLGAALLAAAGVALLLWALWDDWLRGVRSYRRTGARRRRCPKCWYDMAGVEGLRCPECGRTQRREARLHRARRQRRLAAIACGVGALAWVAARAPQVRRHGWPSVAPTTVLILALPFLEPSAGNAMWNPWSPRPAAPKTASEQVVAELVERLQSKKAQPWWQRRLLVDLCAPRADGAGKLSVSACGAALRAGTYWRPLTRREWRRHVAALLPKSFVTRDSWPVGVDVYVTPGYPLSVVGPELMLRPIASAADTLRPVDIGFPGSITYFDGGAHRVARTTEAASSVMCEAVGRSVDPTTSKEGCTVDVIQTVIGDYPLPITVRGTLRDYMQPVDMPEVDEALRRGEFTLRWVGANGNGSYSGAVVVLDEASTMRVFDRIRREGATLAVHLELLHDDLVVAEGRAWWNKAPVTQVWTPATGWAIVPHAAFETPKIPAFGEWRLRISPDPETALRDYTSDKCWAGEPIEVALRVAPPELSFGFR